MCRFIETIRIENGMAENLSAHNHRMNDTRKANFLSVGDSFPDYIQIEDYISPSGYKELTRCRVVYSSKIEQIEYFPYKVRTVRTLCLVEDNEADYTFKSADRTVLDRNFLKRGDADDVVIVRNGLLTDTSIANIALLRSGIWYTPRLPLLKGTRRRSLLDTGLVVEADIKAADLFLYEKIRIFNAMIPFGEIELDVRDSFSS